MVTHIEIIRFLNDYSDQQNAAIDSVDNTYVFGRPGCTVFILVRNVFMSSLLNY